MSAFSAAAQDEDGDTISALRAENEQLRQALLTANDTLVKVARAGALHAQAAACLRETVIRWAARAEQAEDMLEAIGAGGGGSKVARQDHPEQHLNMVPAGWKLVPVNPTTKMIDAARSQSSFPAGVWRAMLAAAPQPPVVEQPQVEQEPVTARHRFRNPQRGTPDWSVWQPCKVEKRPVWEIDSQGFEVEYQALYTHPQPKRQPLTGEQQIAKTLCLHGLALVKTANGYDVLELGQITAHKIGGDA